MNNKISLRIHSVKCVDETGGSFVERFGNDEIALSGFGIDAAANTVQVKPFDIGSNFDDGETKRFSPPRRFVTLNIPKTFPATFSVGFLLAEKDNGDFGSKVGKIFAKVTEEIEKKKKEEVQKKGRTGSAALTGAEIAVIWELAKPFVFSFVKDKIIGAANDDIFPLQDVSVTVPSADFTFAGGKDSQDFSVEFRGHGGVYRMTCDWQLS
jgi:hypothetical protein